MGVPDGSLPGLASAIREEVLSVQPNIIIKVFRDIYPDAASVNDQIVYNWTFAERNFLDIYADDAVNATAVLAANYLYFVYTQDGFLKSVLTAAPKKGPSRAIANFLMSGEVRTFRNAFAHGRWRYVGESSIEYTRFKDLTSEVSILDVKTLILWQSLSKIIIAFWSARAADVISPLNTGGDLDAPACRRHPL